MDKITLDQFFNEYEAALKQHLELKIVPPSVAPPRSKKGSEVRLYTVKWRINEVGFYRDVYATSPKEAAELVKMTSKGPAPKIFSIESYDGFCKLSLVA
jgi:hypothetical protein